ncbi:hypothetical protein FAZ95_30700 [Trinickia violacea]|uniref:Uncharacterized protein n=1 Tax=Trinickia violacea TaxID=2571746 RepID=A0A4P8IW54_9BURK|nr:hypothetical protein [Trinickia violacea]QCP53422.1 hypothetical protein FAZ95_30700 [Trinickia violacea]
MSIRISACACIALLTISGTALAQRPVVYPARSQSPAQQAIDNALCYGQANSQTHIDMARQPQKPTRTTPINFAADAGHGASAPPLPPGIAASGAHPASGAATASAASGAASGTPMAAASDAAAASGAASSTTLALGPASASGALGASGASGVQMPPLPPPEPPMTTYWRAYGDCMQDRGYVVR